MKPINVGLLGIGTVGGGTFAVLDRNREEISRRAGCAITMKMVADKELDKARRLVGGRATVTADAKEVVSNPDIDIVVELIGGTTIAKDLMIGMPPPTAASNATITSFFCAAAKISLPWRARSALLAVTMCLPLAMACFISS